MPKTEDDRKLETAISLHQKGNLNKAAALYRQLIKRNSNNFYALHYLGLIEAIFGNLEQAKSLMARSLSLQPFNIMLIENCATMAHQMGDYPLAIRTCQHGLQINNASASLLTILGVSLSKTNQLPASLAQFDRLLAHHPNHVDAINERGTVLAKMKQYDAALESFDNAAAIKPDFAEAHLNAGTVYWEQKRYVEASAAYGRALALNPDLNFAEGARLHSKLHVCDWINFDTESARLRSSVANGKASTLPLTFLAIPSTADEQLQCAKLWIANRYLASDKPLWCGGRYSHGRIRVAYLSADFRPHPVAFLLAGMFEHHDRSRFEISGLSIGPDDDSEIRTRLEASFDHFTSTDMQDGNQIAELVRAAEIDILVDLNGLTENARTDILAKRPAPIQVNFLGYPGTMGANYIDYIIADRIVIPENRQSCYSERIVRLPNSYLVGDATLSISDKAFTRAELELPPAGFVFCCFNNNYKITPRVFDSWMRILKNVEHGVLWLRGGDMVAEGNLRREAVTRGVSPDRLIFAKPFPLLTEHLARHRSAELFLDTLPYNAHATASHALWAGVPVLTCLGETFAGRVAASLLNAIQLPELITTSLEAYEALAIELASNPAKLAEIKRRLTRNRLTAPLFNTQQYTRHIESAYTEMYERYQAGLTPADIYVPNS